MKESSVLSKSRTVIAGLVGGIIGAIVMGGAAYMMPISVMGANVPFFAAAAVGMGVSESVAVGAGWGLHILTGLIVGAIFGGITGSVRKLGLTSISRALGFGVVAGIVVFLVFFLPLMAGMMPSLMGMGSLIAAAFGAHILYGIILGGVAYALLPKAGAKRFKCEMCGATLGSKEELMNHAKEHMKGQQQFKCEICGATFRSKDELMEHAKKAHPMRAS